MRRSSSGRICKMASKSNGRYSLRMSVCAILAVAAIFIAQEARAQNQSGGQPGPTPTPAAGSGSVPSATDPLVSLVLVAENLIPKLQEAIESPLVSSLENLAFWIAVIVMMLSFARLFREN